MIEEVLQYIRKENLIQTGDHVYVGISGGADSVCLLLVLAKLQEKISFALRAVHVEHGIRGEESKEDALFVKNLCDTLQVERYIYNVNVPEYAKRQGLGLEEAARILRYECYGKALQEGSKGEGKIALAHHADDNAETILFQMVRGSGIDGLCGMQPKATRKDGLLLIRPFLSVTREQIEAYLQKEGQAYRTDATNSDVAYSRNRIRHCVLPELKKVNPRAVAHMNQSAEILSGLQDYLAMQVKEISNRAMKRESDAIVISYIELENLPEVMKREVIHLGFEYVAGSVKDIGMVHLCAVTDLFASQVGRRISLPYGLEAERIYEGVRIKKISKKETVEEVFSLMIKKEQLEAADGKTGFCVQVPGGTMRFRLFDFDGEMQEFSKKTYTKWLKYDSIKGSLQIRSRQEGDYLTLDEAGHKKRLKEYFINEKIPSSERNKILLLMQESSVVWVVGRRIGAEYKIDRDTQRVLEVQFLEEVTHEN